MTISETHINIYTTDPNWIASHRDEIVCWLSTELLSLVYREIFTNAQEGLSTYQTIKKTLGFASAEQEVAIDTMLHYRGDLLKLIAEISEEYNLILHRLHNYEDVSISGAKLIVKLYSYVHPIALKIDDIGERLAKGEFGLTSDNQKLLLILATEYNKKLLAIVDCLSIWVSVHNDKRK